MKRVMSRSDTVEADMSTTRGRTGKYNVTQVVPVVFLVDVDDTYWKTTVSRMT
jgi:hypothetical protein